MIASERRAPASWLGRPQRPYGVLERERGRLPTARSLSAGTGANLAFECHVWLAHSKDE